MNAPVVEVEVTRKRGLDGEITFRTDGQPIARIDDELWHQFLHLARAMIELRAASASAVPYSTMPGGYELVSEGESLVITGDYLTTARFPRAAFTIAVLSAADRWLAEAEQRGGDEADVALSVREAVAAARAAEEVQRT